MTLNFSTDELAAVTVAAVRHGVLVGAYCAGAAVRDARDDNGANPLHEPWVAVRVELMASRRQARNVGGLLNQLAAAFHATGELGPTAGAIVQRLDRVVADLDELTSGARTRLP